MGLFVLEQVGKGGQATADKVTAMIVEADDAAKARLLAIAQDNEDSSWTDSTSTAIVAGVASDFKDFVYNIKVSGPASTVQVPNPADFVDASYTGIASDTVDLIGAGLVIALNNSYRESMLAAIADDGGVFTDETTESNEATADDMTLLPAVPASGDNFNFGSDKQFNRLVLNVSTVGTGTYTLTWEYFNGSSFTALSGVTDGTTDFKTSGLKSVTFTIPGDWATTTINSQGPFFFIRAVVDAGTTTAIPLGQQSFTALADANYTSGTNTLECTVVADGLGDRTLAVTATPPNSVGSLAELLSTIVDQGIAAAVLSVILAGPTAIPAVLKKL